MPFIFILPYIGVKIIDFAPFGVEQLSYHQSGAFAIIVYILFIGDTELKHLCAVQRLFMPVENIGRSFNGIFRHLIVDHHRSFYHRSVEAVFTRLPRQVIRVERYTMSAEPGTGIKRLEAIRLCLCRVDDFPNADAHFMAELGKFVDQTDIYIAVCVFQYFFHFRHGRR